MQDQDHDHGPDRDPDQDLPKRELVRKIAAPGRNEPCWCGSTRKYKTCHWKADRASR
jgi:uncharacterized protein YecA (UPF0149 family)